MGQTNRKYPVMEVGIFTQNYPDHNNERAKEGDIIAMRGPHYVIGTLEHTNYLWLRIEGLEENDFVLNGLNYDKLEPDDLIDTIWYDKRRYCIPLHRLKEIFPPLDINRARDNIDKYQPFMILDEDTGKYLTPQKPFSVHGLVFDKAKGEYL